MTHDPIAATLGPLNAAHEMLDDADIVRGPIPSRVRAVLADLRHVRAERDALRAARMDPDPTEAADVHLCNAIAAAHDGNLNLASSEATKALACLGLDSAFVATVSRAENAPPPEPAASERVAWVTYPGDSGPVLHIDGRERGNIVLCDDGTWLASALGAPQVLAIPDEPTALVVLLALAGEDPGVTVALSLRASWTRSDVDRARDAGLGDYAAPLLEGYAEGWDGAQHTKDPDVIRAWVAGGQGLMTLRVVEGGRDAVPF